MIDQPNHVPTSKENKLAEALKREGIMLQQQYEHKGKTVDIFIPDAKLVIEVDGSHHLTEPEQILKDFHREFYDELEGIHTLHIPNSFINDEKHFNEVINAIIGVRDLLIHEFGKDFQLFKEHKEHYINQLLKNAEYFLEAVYILEHSPIKKRWSMFFLPGGFIASRSAECYLKSLILHKDPTEKGFKSIRRARHDLIELLDVLLYYDRSASCLSEDLATMNKYSGTKVVYPEYMMRCILSGSSEVYGNDYIESLYRIKSYVEARVK